MALTSLSVKGHVVIPKELRAALGLQPGTKLLILLEANELILMPVKRNLAAELFGKYKDVDLLTDARREHRQEIKRGLASK